jgi:hypothetical protein
MQFIKQWKLWNLHRKFMSNPHILDELEDNIEEITKISK